MTTPTPEQLHHLANRARHGVALPAEHDQLAAGITATAAALDDVTEELAEALDHNDQTCEAVTRRDQAEAAIKRVRNLAERWRHTGDRKGSPLRELLAALDQAQPPTT